MTSEKTRSLVGVLGCGQMGSAIVKGLEKAYPENFQFHTFTPSVTRARELAEAVGGKWHEQLSQVPHCHYYLLGCKPQQFAELAKELQGPLSSADSQESVVISLLAGTSVSTLQKSLGGFKRVVRVMPNISCRLNQGVSLLFFAPEVPLQEKEKVSMIFRAVGKIFPLQKEESMDYLTGVTGSGPAFVFELASILQKLLMQAPPLPVDFEMSREMVQQTFLGAAMLMQESGDSFEELRERVTSKGGVTYAALQVLQKGGFSTLMEEALQAAYHRSLQLKAEICK